MSARIPPVATSKPPRDTTPLFGRGATSGQPFAKLFDTPHGQLIAFLDYDESAADDNYTVCVIGAEVDGVVPRANLGYKTEADRQRGFEKIDQAGAEDMAAKFHNMVAGMAA